MPGKKFSTFNPFKIGALTAKNRLVRSATFEFAADNGRVTAPFINHYRELAEGGVGLIISGMAAIRPGAAVGPIQLDVSNPNFCQDLAQVIQFTKERQALFFVQLNHAGYRTGWPRGDRLGVMAKQEGETFFQMATAEDLKAIALDFAKAARNCREGGADGVQIHAAHGFLISSFLSPYFNQRSDAYGGPMANRGRLLREVLAAIRAAVGPDYPVGVKLHFNDGVNPSTTPDECLELCQSLVKEGLDLIEVSSGVNGGGGSDSYSPLSREEGYFQAGAAYLAARLSVPVVSVGGYRTLDFIEKTLNDTAIAAVAMCRPYIREPDLPRRWELTDPSPAFCVSCNRCFRSKDVISCLAV
ncbi:MAG: NADH:flavin oxidoreductase [Deltaproteobacteria bacterium]|jgi:2,4-dienoyl-CoA reductase-like NADH-dependent reductase (Old Yellow Enzyme family)|nr:NADH:flavin oxidoreductase [Deltaproteobacteria bacterium]